MMLFYTGCTRKSFFLDFPADTFVIYSRNFNDKAQNNHVGIFVREKKSSFDVQCVCVPSGNSLSWKIINHMILWCLEMCLRKPSLDLHILSQLLQGISTPSTWEDSMCLIMSAHCPSFPKTLHILARTCLFPIESMFWLVSIIALWQSGDMGEKCNKKVVNFGNWFLCQFSPKTYKFLHGASLTP